MMFVLSLEIIKLITRRCKRIADARVWGAMDHNTCRAAMFAGGASPTNAICADLTPFPMLVSRLMIRMAH